MMLLLLAFLLLCSAFFSLSEMALVALSKLRLRHMVGQKVRNAVVLDHLVKHIDNVIASLVVSNNFANTAISTIGAALCIRWVGPEWGVLVATFVMGAVILLFGEITPKVLALRHTDRMALRVAPVLRVVLTVVGPVADLFTRVSNGLLRLFGVRPGVRSPLVTEEEIKIMIEVGKEQGVLGEDERNLLHRIFEFGDLKVEDVMVPRDKMVMVHEGAAHDEVLTVLTEQGHSRVPVYRDSQEKVVGIIYAQEMLHIWREGWLIALHDLIHPPFEVSSDRRVSDLLREFQKRHVQIAIVVDSQGHCLGLVTLEDLIEEIVGEIEELSP